MKKFIIVCLSNQFYDSPLKTNKHLVMDILAKRGFKVIFVDPPTRFKFFMKILKNKRINLIDKKKKNFYVYTPVNLFNFYPFSWLSNIFHILIIRRLIRNFKFQISNFKLFLWVYHFDFPRIWDIDKYLKPDIFIYDVVDDYASFPEYSKRDLVNKGVVKVFQVFDRYLKELIDQRGKKGIAWVNYRETQLASRADIMFASHPLLFEKFEKLSKNIYYTPNAGDFELYSKNLAIKPIELLEIQEPLVGYSGALDAYKFDVDLLIYTAKKTPEISYILIGPMQLSDSDVTVQELKKLKNVHLLGVKSSAETAALTHFFDSYIIPYQVNDYTYNGCFPVKFFNSLAAGIPVVVTDLPAYKGFEKVLYLAKNKEDFVRMVRKSVKDKDLNKRKERIFVASQNTWEHKVNKQLKAIEDYFRRSN